MNKIIIILKNYYYYYYYYYYRCCCQLHLFPACKPPIGDDTYHCLVPPQKQEPLHLYLGGH